MQTNTATHKRDTYGTRQQGAILGAESKLLPDAKFTSTLILDFLSSRRVGNKCLVFINHTV